MTSPVKDKATTHKVTVDHVKTVATGPKGFKLIEGHKGIIDGHEAVQMKNLEDKDLTALNHHKATEIKSQKTMKSGPKPALVSKDMLLGKIRLSNGSTPTGRGGHRRAMPIVHEFDLRKRSLSNLNSETSKNQTLLQEAAI